MSDTGQELVIESNETEQPTESVVAEVEVTSDSPQSQDTVEYELQLDHEGEPEKTPEKKPDPEKARKAYQERERKRKEKEEQEKRDREREERLTNLERKNAMAEVGNYPDIEDYDWDKAAHRKAVEEYYNKINSIPNSSTASSQDNGSNEVVNSVPTNVLINADKQEDNVRAKYHKYDSDRVDLEMKFVDLNIDPTAAMNEIKTLCNDVECDFAKVVIALNNVPGEMERMAEAAKRGQVALAKFFSKSESKVKFSQAKKIDSVPEPNINSSGSVDNSTSQLAKAYKDWKEETNQYKQLQKWNHYLAIKKKVKQNG